MIEEASTPIENEDDELVEKIVTRLQSSARNSRRELAIDLHMQTGSKRTNLDMIIDQLIRDEIVIEKEVKKSRGPGTNRLFVKMNGRS
jgi:methionine synthase II (cobalamin-independent)